MRNGHVTRQLLSCAIISLYIFATCVTANAQSTAFGVVSPHQNGRYPVGFEIVQTADSSRAFGGTRARPMQVSIWYPAVRNSGTAMRYSDYVQHLATEGKQVALDSAGRASALAEFSDYYVSIGGSRAVIERLYAEPVIARRAAIRVPGTFPIVLLAVGLAESPSQHTALGEFLAANGYIVASVPTMGRESRDIGFTAEAVEANYQDLLFLLNFARRRSTGTMRVGVIGYSFGSGAALMVSRNHHEVKAIVSVDGSIGFKDRIPIYMKAKGFADDAGCTPLLHMNVAGLERNDLRVVTGSRCTQYIVSFADADHLDFSTTGLVAGRVPEFRSSRWGFRRSIQPDAVFETAARLTLLMLDAFVRGDPAAHLKLERSPRPIEIAGGEFEIRRFNVR